MKFIHRCNYYSLQKEIQPYSGKHLDNNMYVIIFHTCSDDNDVTRIEESQN